MSYLSLLPKDLQYEPTQYLSGKKLLKISQSDEKLKDIYKLWALKAEKDFGYPSEMYLIHDRDFETQIQHYNSIKRMIPSKENLDILNKMCTQYDFKTNKWRFDSYMLEVKFKISTKEADEFIDQLENEEFLYDGFINSNFIQLTNTIDFYNNSLNIKSKIVKLDTLIRGKKNSNVNFNDIITNTRNVISDFMVDFWGIDSYKYRGFNSNGFPVLEIIENA